LPSSTARKAHEVRSYDFRRPDKFSKEQLRTLHMLHENYARHVSTLLSAQLRSTAEVSVGSVEQMSYGEYSRRLANPGVIAVLSLAPLSSNAMFEVEPSIAMLLVDRVLGGSGDHRLAARELTEIEQAVTRRMITAMIEFLKDGWRNIADIHPRIESIETNPMFAQIVAPSEMCAVIALNLTLGDIAGSITLCLPYLMMEPILPKLSAFVWFAGARQADAPTSAAKVQARLEEVAVSLVAELGGTSLTLRELLELGSGDIVQLDRAIEEALPVYIDRQHAMWARPGVHRGRLALQITGRLEEVPQ
jgi:flagellar motor switch protein FliM